MASSKETYQRLHIILNKAQLLDFHSPIFLSVTLNKSSNSVRQVLPLTKLQLLLSVERSFSLPGHAVKIAKKKKNFSQIFVLKISKSKEEYSEHCRHVT